MFAYTGLNTSQVNELRDKYGIYMTADGRISIAGLNTKNLDYISDAFHQVTKDQGIWLIEIDKIMLAYVLYFEDHESNL